MLTSLGLAIIELMKKFLLILVVVITLVAIPVSVFLVFQRQELRKRAAPATTLTLAPANITKKVGEVFSVEVGIDTADNQVVAAEIHLVFDPTKLEAQTITNGPLFPNVLASGVVDRGTAAITVGAPSTTAAIKGTGTAAVVKFKTLENTVAPTSVRFAANTFVGALGESATNVLIGTTPATVTIADAGDGTAPSPSLVATPSALPNQASFSVPQATSSSTSTTPINLSDKFSDAKLDSNLWVEEINNPKSTLTLANGKLKTTTYSDGKGNSWAGIATKNEFTGDFQAQIKVDSLQVPATTTGSAEFQIYAPQKGLTLAWVKKRGGTYFELSSSSSKEAGIVSTGPIFEVGDANSVTLKLTRTGSTAQAFVDTGSGLRQIGTLDNVFTGNGKFSIATILGDGNSGQISGVFDDFSATVGIASSLATPPTATTSGQATTTTLKITSPTQDGQVAAPQPVIKGKAAPGSTITITIYSTPQTVVVTADANGNWSYTPQTPLAPGPHNVVAAAQNPTSGQTETTTTNFVVASGQDATQSAIPVSGNTAATLLLIASGILLVAMGILIPVFL